MVTRGNVVAGEYTTQFSRQLAEVGWARCKKKRTEISGSAREYTDGRIVEKNKTRHIGYSGKIAYGHKKDTCYGNILRKISLF